MGANKTDEIVRTSYAEGSSKKGGGLPPDRASPRAYDDDAGGDTGWFTPKNKIDGRVVRGQRD